MVRVRAPRGAGRRRQGPVGAALTWRDAELLGERLEAVGEQALHVLALGRRDPYDGDALLLALGAHLDVGEGRCEGKSDGRWNGRCDGRCGGRCETRRAPHLHMGEDPESCARVGEEAARGHLQTIEHANRAVAGHKHGRDHALRLVRAIKARLHANRVALQAVCARDGIKDASKRARRKSLAWG